jgi:DNA-binding NarL/FixJ family response regulator
VRVLIVDDQRYFRQGLRTVLEASDANIEVIDEAGDGEQAAASAWRLQPDVVLLDVHMPGTDGIQAAKAITECAPDARILMLTVSDDPEDVALATRAGAAGYLLKDRSMADVIDAIMALVGGRAWPLAAG